MSVHRIFIISNVRPSRTWRIAKRLMQEVEGIALCGIVQRCFENLPEAEKFITRGQTYNQAFPRTLRLQLWSRLRHICGAIIDFSLWCLHGSPQNLDCSEFTTADLARKCGQMESGFFAAEEFADAEINQVAAQGKPELTLVLGDWEFSRELIKIPARGCLQVTHSFLERETSRHPEGMQARIDLLTASSERSLAHITIPRQSYDDLTGMALKADLVCDDLAVQSTIQMLNRSMNDAANAVKTWIEELYSPYLQQIGTASEIPADSAPMASRHRKRWKLLLETLILCSPLFIARNWYRRVRRRYPVVILTHHLISDRVHRMGMPTEVFWRQLQYLKRHYRVVGLTEAVALLDSGRLDTPIAVLTFDDGYIDNFVGLRAVAEEAGIPVTLFIATQPVELRQEFQHDVENGVRGALPLTWNQLRHWSRHKNVEFGAHTRTHFNCGSTEPASLEWEIAGSKCDLEQRLGIPVKYFAFPFGQPDNISSTAFSMAKTYYQYVLSGFGGENYSKEGNRNPHLLRKNLYANMWELELDLQGVFDFVDRLKNKFHLKQAPAASASPSRYSVFSPAVADSRNSGS